MIRKINPNKNIDIINIGQRFFYVGAFLLPSAFVLGAFALVISIVISLYKNFNLYLKDGFNKIFLFATFLLLISCFFNQIKINSDQVNYWIGTLNWIPFFVGFFTFQFYLDSPKKRFNFSLILILGSFPVFFSCITQYFFGWYGPFETLNGLIVWFQKPLYIYQNQGVTSFGVSGLFSNANYSGQWLSMIFPFSLILLFRKSINPIKRTITFFLNILILYLALLTESRNAFLGFLISIPALFGLKGLISLVFFIGIIYLFNYLNLVSFFPAYLQEIIMANNPGRIFIKLRYLFKNENIRIQIWNETLSKIFDSPLFGWGAGSFSLIILLSSNNIKITHAHNLPLELAFNYGIPASTIISLTVFFILFKAGRIIYKQNKTNFENLINRAWLASASIVVFSHISDVTYYDGRISISFWILLAGLKKIIDKER